MVLYEICSSLPLYCINTNTKQCYILRHRWNILRYRLVPHAVPGQIPSRPAPCHAPHTTHCRRPCNPPHGTSPHTEPCHIQYCSVTVPYNLPNRAKYRIAQLTEPYHIQYCVVTVQDKLPNPPDTEQCQIPNITTYRTVPHIEPRHIQHRTVPYCIPCLTVYHAATVPCAAPTRPSCCRVASRSPSCTRRRSSTPARRPAIKTTRPSNITHARTKHT